MKKQSDRDVWAIALLLYPTKGKNREVCTPLVDALGNEGIEVYRNIFANNNKNLL